MIRLTVLPQIQYLPICTECGKIITGEVNLIKHRAVNSRGNICMDWEIEPEVCPECGAKFVGITVYHPIIKMAKEG